MIPISIVNLFIGIFGVDMSNVSISHEGDFSGCTGYYKKYSNQIHVKPGLTEELEMDTIVHELTHLMQFEHNKSLSLNLSFITAEDYAAADAGIAWDDMSLEVDAVLTELYFMYKRDFSSIRTIREKAKKKFSNVQDYEHLAERINSIRIDNSFKNVIIDTLLV